MQTLQFTEILPYSASDLHDVVMDVARYKEISSLIKDITFSDRPGIDVADWVRDVNTRIETPLLPMAFHYGCELESISAPHKIKARATKSPFTHMSGEMRFDQKPDGVTEVHCQIYYKTGWNPLAIAAAKIMESQIARGIEIAKGYLGKRLEPVDTRVQGPLNKRDPFL